MRESVIVVVAEDAVNVIVVVVLLAPASILLIVLAALTNHWRKPVASVGTFVDNGSYARLGVVR